MYLNKVSISEVIEMAWCDKTSFDDIFTLTGLSEADTVKLMRINLKPTSFRLWRKRVSGRKTKHKKLGKDSDCLFSKKRSKF